MLSLTFHTHTHSRGAGTRGKECSTGQRRPILQDKAKKEKTTTTVYSTREERERDTKEPDYQRKKLEHLPKDPIGRSKV
jgi:hypothetical protein